MNYKCKWWVKLGGGSRHGARVATWHGRGGMVMGHEGPMDMCMNIHAYGGYTWAERPYRHEHMIAWLYGVPVIHDINSFARVQ